MYLSSPTLGVALEKTSEKKEEESWEKEGTKFTKGLR